MIGRRWHSIVLDVRSFKGADCDTDYCVVIEMFRESLAVGKQSAQRFDISAGEQPQDCSLDRAATVPEFIELTRLIYKERKKHTKILGAMKKVASPRLERKYIAFLT